MRHSLIGSCVLTALLALGVAAVPASAQTPASDHIVPATALASTLTTQAKTDAANRASVIRALDQSQVQTMAKQMGLDVTKAKAAVGQLSGDELARVAAPANTVNHDLAGGATTVVISITTVLLILILIVLIVK